MEVNTSFLTMKAKKKLGQNFLVDDSIIKKIVNSFNTSSNDLIIEIGPGRGALTKKLIDKNTKLIAYELDDDLIPILKKLENHNVSIIHDDILKANIENDIKDVDYENLYIIGNLPYYITTPIIKGLIKKKLDAEEMVFMVQNEVADRFCAKVGTKNYSSITLFLKYYYDLEKLFVVNKNAFNPVPKVDSAIIKMKKRINKPVVDESKYFKLINDAFSQKRKTLKNNLKNYDFNIIQKILFEYGKSSQVRAEELSEEIFIRITNSL